jgi:hypothetical protein
MLPYKSKRAFWQGDLGVRRDDGVSIFRVSGIMRGNHKKEGTSMTLAMYILIGVILVAAIYFIIKGKK